MEAAQADLGAKPTKTQIKARAVSPVNGQPVPNGRPKGTPNRVTQGLREAIEAACQPGACHPDGLRGWLVDRATGTLGDRQIFAGLVAKVVPAHIHTTGTGAVTINLGWLTGRSVGGSDTLTVHPDRKSLILEHDNRTINPDASLEPIESQKNTAAETPIPADDRLPGGG
jgi:hypothetical protein